MKISRYLSFLCALSAFIFTSCEDKLPYISEEIGEGEATINAEVEFHALEPALESRAAGNAVDAINELWVVIYNVNSSGTGDQLYEKIRIYDSTDNDYVLPGSDFSISKTNTANPGDAPTVTPPSGPNVGPNDGAVSGSGEATPKASFKLTHIPYGRYKIFAVANVDLTDVDCSSIEKLRSTRFNWNTNVTLDNQMFGYFTPASVQTSNADAPVLTVSQDVVTLHSWIKRLVSKVTVSFDPSGLNESIRIYIKSVTIHDIPASCALGKKNTPDAADQLIKNGESFTYYNPGQDKDSDHEKWKIVLSRGSGPKGETDHTEADPALYFFENMQGNFNGQPDYDKRQQVSGQDQVGTNINEPGTNAEGNPNDYKDRVSYGTYIEVEAYYNSFNKDKISEGPIKYRFMLGKNSTFDYNAERNYHYKLTLKFRGWANEVDWHIDYHEYTPTLITPEPYYISYLYGQEMEFPARVILPPGEDLSRYTVKAEIVENNWFPWDRDANNGAGARPAQYIGPTTDIDGFAWNVPAYNDIYPCVNYTPEKYNVDFPYSGANYVGFLSLRPNESDVIGSDAEIRAMGLTPDDNGYGATANTYLQNYYKNHDLAVREFRLNGTEASQDPVDKSVSVKIPMYTRNKEMVPATDFSGNNPFNSYFRYAKVRFTLWKDGQQMSFKNGKDEDEMERISTIYQVPRVENPKAIYRDWDNDASFAVKLMTLPEAGTSTFKAFTSDGPWRVSVMCETEDFIRLTDRSGSKTVSGVGNYIYGSTDETIEFTYKPKDKLSSSNSTRCGIIKVEYNDYNCVHLIIVRQGYHKGVKLGQATWSCYNVYATADQSASGYTPGNATSVNVALTRSPLSVGSYLKRNQYNYSIREANNQNYGWLKYINNVDISTVYLNASGTTQTRNVRWGNIEGYGWTNFAGTATRYDRKWADTWTAVGGFCNGERFDVPTAADYISLRDNSKFGYGIVYADGATATAETFAVATGYTDYDNQGTRSANGIRACVAYNEDNGDNIIFPLSAVGQARRTRQIGSGTSYSGTISYGGVTSVLSSAINRYRPLTYDLYRTPGAVYWVKQPVLNSSGQPDYPSWDINYLTLVFNPYAYNSLGGWSGTAFETTDATRCSDALPIKLKYK